MLTIYHHSVCPFSRKLRAILKEKKVDFKLQEERYWERNDYFLAINPMGETPVLRIPSEINFQTHDIRSNNMHHIDYHVDDYISGNYAIMEYVESFYPGFQILTGDLKRDAKIRKVAEWFDKKFYDEVTKHIIQEKIIKILLTNSESSTPNSAAIRVAKKNLAYHLDYIDFLLEEDQYLSGSQITMADYAAASQLSVLDMMNDVEWSDHQRVKSWYALIKSRGSFRSILSDYIHQIKPPSHYQDPDF